ncbi:MAG: T9SS type A sorting domain-containing protein [Ginsengibacter sp.]
MRNDSLQTELLRFQNVIILIVKEIRLAASGSKALALFFCSVIIYLSASADYTVANGANINAASLVGQSGVLTINGTVTLSSDVTLAGITDVIINAPNGKIYWSNNSNLFFSVGSNITINNSAPGLQASGSNGSQRLYIGNAIVAVSSDNANNADFSFAEFNQLGGLPKYNINSNSNVCSGSAIISSVIPAKNAAGVNYNFSWSITPSAGAFTYNSDHSVSNIFPANGTYTITCVASANSYETIFNFNITVSAAYTWKGINTNWSDAANWCPGIPGTAASVTIPSGVQSPVILSGNTASVDNLNIDSGASLTVNGTLRIAGSVYNSGTFDATSGTIEMNGSSAQSISGSMFVNKTIQNLIVSNTGSGLSVSSVSNDTLKITGAITFGSATATFNMGDNITLVSNSLGTARVGAVGAANAITGKVTVERYINTGIGAGQHSKSWQFLSAPTSGQTIKESWMENGNLPGYYGTTITGPAGTTAGFDMYSVAPSMKYFDAAINNWKGVSSANDPIANTGGYMVFIRGDRTVTGTTQAANSTVLRSKGNLFTGTQMPIAVKANSFQSVGNPYASPIDFALITKDPSIDNAFYVYDPYLYGSYGVGGYQVLSGVNNWKPVPGGTSAYPSSVLSSIIQSGQAFFVHSNSNTDGSLTISEASKSATARPGHSNRETTATTDGDRQFLRASLFTSAGLMADGNVVAFDKTFRNTIDGNDVIKLSNSGENFGIKSAGKLLTIEAKSQLSGNDTITYNVTNLSKATYKLIFAPENMAATELQGILIDTYLKAEIPVSLRDSTVIEVTINTNAASSAADRFKLVFRQLAALPVNITSITAINKEEKNIIHWSVENEIDIRQYAVEKSTDGNQFSQMVVVNANHTENGHYISEDSNVNAVINYYRIRIVSKDGKVSYSPVVKVNTGKIIAAIEVTPNPILNGTIHLVFRNEPSGKYTISLSNQLGQVILSKTIRHTTESASESISANSISKGIYNLLIVKPDGNKQTVKIIY